MRFLIIFLLLTGVCFAEEFISSKPLDAGELVKEIGIATGLTLTGKDQVGYMSTYGSKIEIKLKDRELTQDEKNKIELAISFHDSEKIKQEQKATRIQKEAALKTKFGWTDEDLKTLKEIFE